MLVIQKSCVNDFDLVEWWDLFLEFVNHIREGSTTASALCRIGSAKTVFQVLCRPCQELLLSTSSLRDHCDSVVHRTNLRQAITHYRCRLCVFDTPHKQDAIGHMTCHEASTWPRNTIGEFSPSPAFYLFIENATRRAIASEV
ncbi:hypothetical protein Q1695_010680 [Nippostrongylus brasiliensis]|nr:hypothetical protein Q1695_010680 [Nippostrongylus brasiliensis]